MRSTSFRRAAAALGLTLGVLALPATPALAKPGDPVKRQAFSLFALPIDILQVNNIFCPVSNRGKVCVNQNDNPLLEGGFWPRGTPDSYIYNSGLQIGGVILNSPFTGGTADTVGVYFMDPRGSQFEGEGLTNVFNSANTADQASWPTGAVARDPAIYNAVLLGKKIVSQQDVWVRVWDGNPANTIGGSHPLGIVVDQRGMAWNYPTGNEDIIYFIYTVYNVSASNPAKYNNPTIVNDSVRAEIAAIGAQFKALNDQKYGISIPADGYTITSTFLAFFEDCDVGVNSGSNYATANFVFNLSFCYKSDFFEPTWTFPTDIFSAPLFVGPGFTGVKYLKSPLGDNGKELGLTLFSNTGNPTSSGGAGYIDARGGKQLYRYLSGTSSPAAGDNACTNQGQQLALRYCFLFQTPVDARFFMSSGPFTLPAGESRTIVVAYVQAAALGTQFTAGCAVGGDCHSSPPPSPVDLASGADTIRTIDKLAGWVSATDANANDTIEQGEVTTFPRTLFNKSLVAQTVFDNKFLLPFSPEQPDFFLLPGNGKATIVWRPSASETVKAGGGDPYFEVASNPTSPLYDPNFRQYDVEGYRIYRGRSPSDLRLVAQFDYAGTVLRDFTGSLAYPADLDEDGRLGRCAPELGIFDDCPVGFPATGDPIDPTVYVDHPIAGDIVQIPLGGRVELADGSVLITKADTAVVGGGSGNLPLTDGGVPFAFVDSGLVNSFTYFYAVTAFDVNSFRSGPSSLESPKTTLKTVTPRKEAGQTTAGSITTPVLLSARGDTLNAGAPLPTINATTGIFSGPMPPTNGFQTSLAVFADQLITGGTVTIRIDSVLPGHGDEGDGVGPIVPAQYYVAGFTGATLAGTTVIPLVMDGGSADNSTIGYVPVAGVDSARAAPFQGSKAFSLYSSVALSTAGTWRLQTWGRGDANADPSRSYRNGPRWWTGAANENTPDPNKAGCLPPAGTCVLSDADIALNQTAGAMPGVLIFHLSPYLTIRSVPGREIDAVTATVTRAADFRVYWGAAGVIDSVVDVTHGVKVPFSAKIRASWGIMNDSSFTNTTAPDGDNTVLSLSDVACIDPIPTYVGRCTGTPPAFLMDHAKLTPIAMHSGAFGTTLAATGNGFIFYLNGHFFLMQMAALPTAGTVWNARFYSGRVRMSAADSTQYSFAGSIRPATVPGLRAQFQFTGAKFDSTATTDTVLAHVHTVPDPYYVTNALEISPNTKVLRFVNLPARCIIRIYSTSAILVRVLTHDDPTGGAEESWNLRNRNNQFVASGVYFYHIEAPDGKTKIGRFTVVNYAP